LVLSSTDSEIRRLTAENCESFLPHSFNYLALGWTFYCQH